jgi:two-component system, OmpR family, sensor histidine kinase KdpD
MDQPLRRRTPEELLRQAQADERSESAGRLKVFLGYASGVGKSYRMLDEGRRRRLRGQDVVVGAIQPAVPPDVEELLRGFEMIPLLPNGTMDLDTIRNRHPGVCLVDGLAYDNPPGSRHATRWQDVEEVRSAGIGVISSINIQYVAELREEVETVTGKHVIETVPVAFLKSADEIEIVDAPAEEAPDRAQRLSGLRELALILAADVVDHQLTEYLECHGIHPQTGTHERILVCLTPRANAAQMLDTAAVISERFHAALIAVYVRQEGISPSDEAALQEKLEIARSRGASIEMLEGDDPVDAILDFAHSRGITQLFIGHSRRTGVWARLRGNPVDRLIRRSRGMDVRIFPQ